MGTSGTNRGGRVPAARSLTAGRHMMVARVVAIDRPGCSAEAPERGRIWRREPSSDSGRAPYRGWPGLVIGGLRVLSLILWISLRAVPQFTVAPDDFKPPDLGADCTDVADAGPAFQRLTTGAGEPRHPRMSPPPGRLGPGSRIVLNARPMRTTPAGPCTTHVQT